MRIMILGAGSLGTIIGVFMSGEGLDVELVDVNEDHINKMKDSGAKVTGAIDYRTPVKAITPGERSGTYDLVLLLTKQLHNDTVLTDLLPYINEDSVVLSLQNGVPEDKVTSIVGRKRVIGGSVEFGAEWMEPGVSKLTTEFEQMKKYAFQIGELNGVTTDRIERVQSALACIGGTSISANMVGTKWTKLLINTTYSGISAALNCNFGDLVDHDVTVRSAAYVADETIKIGHEQGVKFEPMLGIDFTALEIKPNDNLEDKVNFLRAAAQKQRSLTASMLQDLERKQKTEIDYLNGAILEKAQGTGISTPFNELIIRLIHQYEDKKIVPKFGENIELFEELMEREKRTTN